jgi:hypothetical protein
MRPLPLTHAQVSRTQRLFGRLILITRLPQHAPPATYQVYDGPTTPQRRAQTLAAI